MILIKKQSGVSSASTAWMFSLEINGSYYSVGWKGNFENLVLVQLLNKKDKQNIP